MKAKTYPTEKVTEIAKKLAQAPALPPREIDHESTLEKLGKEIADLHFKKNYDERTITKMLKENGIKTTLKEVKNLLENRRVSVVKK